MKKIQNARISGTTLGTEDHGIMTAMIYLEGDGWGVGFGGYAFDEWNKSLRRRVGSAYGIEFIMKILETVGVTSWEKLKGEHVRVESEEWIVQRGEGSRLTLLPESFALRIGHITQDIWFDPKALGDEMRTRS